MSTHPSRHHVSVTGLDPETIAKRLEALPIAGVSRVSEHPDVVVVELEDDETDPRAALLEIRELLKDEAQVELALEDDFGNELYPTGTINVRFSDTPSDEELDALGEELGLKCISRNEFQPKQASFEPVDKMAADLSSEISRLEERPEIRKAWPEVWARFRRY